MNSGVKLLVFKNNFKERDNDPDYVAYLAPAKPQGEGDDERPAQAGLKGRREF